MFTTGMSDIAMSIFSAGSMTVSIFTTIQVFAWLATVWRGRPVPTTSMYYALGSIVMLVIGGLSGVFTGVIPVDWQAPWDFFACSKSNCDLNLLGHTQVQLGLAIRLLKQHLDIALQVINAAASNFRRPTQLASAVQSLKTR